MKIVWVLFIVPLLLHVSMIHCTGADVGDPLEDSQDTPESGLDRAEEVNEEVDQPITPNNSDKAKQAGVGNNTPDKELRAFDIEGVDGGNSFARKPSGSKDPWQGNWGQNLGQNLGHNWGHNGWQNGWQNGGNNWGHNGGKYWWPQNGWPHNGWQHWWPQPWDWDWWRSPWDWW